MITGASYAAHLGKPSKRDRLLGFVLASVNGMLLACLVFLFFDLVASGLSSLTLDLLTTDPIHAGREGGIYPVILSTMIVTFIAIAISIPVSVCCGLLLSELYYRAPRLRMLFNSFLFVLAAIPSIAYGLFGNALFVDTLGLGYSVLSGGLTLACMLLPFLVHVCADAFLAVSLDLKYAAVALNLSHFRVARSVLVPIALPAILTGTVLALGRALSETAAVIFTSGYSLRTPSSLLDPGRVVSVHIYDLAMNVVGGQKMANVSALLLMLSVFVIGSAVAALSKFMSARI